MTNVHDLIRLNDVRLTNQQLADMALEEDREARRLRRIGEDARAQVHQDRADHLAGMLQ